MSQEFEKIVLEKLDRIEGTLDEHTEEFKRVNKILNEQSKKIAKNTEEIDGLIEVVQYHTNTLTESEYKFNKKIDTLFDAYKYLDTKVKLNESISSGLKSKAFEHDIRISALEDTVKNDSILA